MLENPIGICKVCGKEFNRYTNNKLKNICKICYNIKDREKHPEVYLNSFKKWKIKHP